MSVLRATVPNYQHFSVWARKYCKMIIYIPLLDPSPLTYTRVQLNTYNKPVDTTPDHTGSFTAPVPPPSEPPPSEPPPLAAFAANPTWGLALEMSKHAAYALFVGDAPKHELTKYSLDLPRSEQLLPLGRRSRDL